MEAITKMFFSSGSKSTDVDPEEFLASLPGLDPRMTALTRKQGKLCDKAKA
jgi:hypothetical protein